MIAEIGKPAPIVGPDERRARTCIQEPPPLAVLVHNDEALTGPGRCKRSVSNEVSTLGRDGDATFFTRDQTSTAEEPPGRCRLEPRLGRIEPEPLEVTSKRDPAVWKPSRIHCAMCHGPALSCRSRDGPEIGSRAVMLGAANSVGDRERLTVGRPRRRGFPRGAQAYLAETPFAATIAHDEPPGAKEREPATVWRDAEKPLGHTRTAG